MLDLDLELLSQVCGGQNVDTSKASDGSQQSTNRTDYAYCADKVTQACQASSPGFLGFGTDQAAARQCTVQNLSLACGTPPKL